MPWCACISTRPTPGNNKEEDEDEEDDEDDDEDDDDDDDDDISLPTYNRMMEEEDEIATTPGRLGWHDTPVSNSALHRIEREIDVVSYLIINLVRLKALFLISLCSVYISSFVYGNTSHLCSSSIS